MNFNFSNFWSNFRKPDDRKSIDPSTVMMYGAVVNDPPGDDTKPIFGDPSTVMMYGAVVNDPPGDDTKPIFEDPRTVMMYGAVVNDPTPGIDIEKPEPSVEALYAVKTPVEPEPSTAKPSELPIVSIRDLLQKLLEILNRMQK